MQTILKEQSKEISKTELPVSLTFSIAYITLHLMLKLAQDVIKIRAESKVSYVFRVAVSSQRMLSYK